MQGTQSRITFKASLLAPVTDAEVAKTNISFLTFEALGIYLHSGFFYCNSIR